MVEYGPKPELIAVCKQMDCDHVISVPNEEDFAGLHLTEQMLDHEHGMIEIQVRGKRCPNCGLEITGIHGTMKAGNIMALPCCHVISAESVYRSTRA